MRARIFVLFATLAAHVGCGDPTRIVEPEGVIPNLMRSATAPVHIVSLGGKLDLSAYNLPDETYAMTARRDGDGNVSGRFTVKLSEPVVSFSGDVTCLQVSGSLAWVGVTITDSDATTGFYAAGGSFWFRLQDNGEGDSSAADRISFLNPNGGAARCNERRTGLGLAYEIQGNVQIR